MKYIFLDFDGVINNWNEFDGVSIENLTILKKIVNQSGAKLIATSSNKYILQASNDIDYHNTIFYKKYVKALNDFGMDIYDLTPLVDMNRTKEIQSYIKEHNIKQYVILDDELIGEELQNHQVFLDLYQGLQEEHIQPCLDILEGRLGFYPCEYDRTETPQELNARINQYYNQLKKL